MISAHSVLFGPASGRDALWREADGYVDRATTMMRRARALVRQDRPDAIPLLTARRASLKAHFGRYQHFKHGSIFDPVVEHGTASSRVVARTMKIDCMELGEVFSAYHTRWLGLRPAEWSSYRRDMESVVDMLQGKLDGELRAIRQLLMISGLHRS